MGVRTQPDALKIMSARLEKEFSKEELIEYIKENDQMSELMYEFMIATPLEEGYPKDSLEELNITITINAILKTWDEWAKISIDYLYGIDDADIEEFFNSKAQLGMYGDYISDFIFEVKIKEPLIEMLERFPDASYLSARIEESSPFDQPDALLKRWYFKDKGAVEEKIKEQMKEIGFPSNVKVSDIDYDMHFTPTMDSTSWGEYLLEQDALDGYANVSTFFIFGIYDFIVDNMEYVNVKVDIKTSPEDFEQEGEL